MHTGSFVIEKIPYFFSSHFTNHTYKVNAKITVKKDRYDLNLCQILCDCFPPQIHIYVIFDPSGITKKFNTVSLSTFSIEDSLCEVWWQTT